MKIMNIGNGAAFELTKYIPHLTFTGEVWVVSIIEKIDHVIPALHCLYEIKREMWME